MQKNVLILYPKNIKRLSGRMILDFLIELAYLLPIFLIPIWFAYWWPTYNIFAFNKINLFKLLVLLLFFFTALKLVFYKVKFSLSPLEFFKRYWAIPTIFIIGLAINLFFSTNRALSFYGSMQRQAGWLSYAFYFFWFILFSFNLLSLGSGKQSFKILLSKRINRLLEVASLSALVVAVYAILQILDIDFLIWPQPPYLTHRALSTFGQPNFLASWLLLVIPLSFYLAWQGRHSIQRCLFAIVGVLELVALFLTSSRGGLVALILVLVALLVYKIVKSPQLLGRKLITITVAVLVLISTLFIFNFYSGGRLTHLRGDKAGAVILRLDFYRAALQSVGQRPLWGNGLENSGQIFIKYYRPDWGVYGKVAQNTDRAHDLILDILLETGLGGLMLFGAIYYFFFYIDIRNSKNNNFPYLNNFLLLGVSAYLLSLLFSFPTVSTTFYFWFFLALVVVIKMAADFAYKDNNNFQTMWSARTKIRPLFIRQIFNIGISLALLLFVLGASVLIIRSVVADYYFNAVIFSLDNHNYQNFLKFDQQLLITNPNIVALRSYDRQIAQELVQDHLFWLHSSKQSVIISRLADIDKLLPNKGYDNLLVKGEINTLLKHFDLAHFYLQQLIKISPFWPPTWLASGDLAWQEHNLSLALVDYHLAQLNTPQVKDPRLNKEHQANVAYYQYLIALKIANVYSAVSNYQAAAKYYDLAYQYYPLDKDLLQKIALDYYQIGNLKLARHYALHGQIRDPHNSKWPLIFSLLNQNK